MRRLCPTYATDINSPLRHVRTRIYFTSESHVHSLINVLRFCQLGAWRRCTRAAAWMAQMDSHNPRSCRSVRHAGSSMCSTGNGASDGCDVA